MRAADRQPAPGSVEGSAPGAVTIGNPVSGSIGGTHSTGLAVPSPGTSAVRVPSSPGVADGDGVDAGSEGDGTGHVGNGSGVGDGSGVGWPAGVDGPADVGSVGVGSGVGSAGVAPADGVVPGFTGAPAVPVAGTGLTGAAAAPGVAGVAVPGVRVERLRALVGQPRRRGRDSGHDPGAPGAIPGASETCWKASSTGTVAQPTSGVRSNTSFHASTRRR